MPISQLPLMCDVLCLRYYIYLYQIFMYKIISRRFISYVSFAIVALVIAGGIFTYSGRVEALTDNNTIERVSVASEGTQVNGHSVEPAISADGRYVAFASNASNLVPGDTNAEGISDVFVHDRDTGVTTRVSDNSFGVVGNNDSTLPVISADGRYVAFGSNASNLVPGDTNDAWDVFVVSDNVTVPYA